jgi:arsenate reductase (glutaredoxin)
VKCREADKLLRASGVEFEKINYYKQPFTVETLREVLQKGGLSPREVLRSGEKIARELGLAKRDLSDDELLALLIEYPDLLQRPLVVRGNKAVLGRPTEKIKEVLSTEC